MNLEHSCHDLGPSVAAGVSGDGRGNGFLWLVDGNAKDAIGAPLARDEVTRFLASTDVMRRDLGGLLAELDREVLPAAARRRGVAGLPTSVIVARVMGDDVCTAFVGEARLHLLGAEGNLVFVSREHNAFNLYPEATWRGPLGWSEEEAKTTVLQVLGSENADVEMHLLPRPPHGQLVAVSHRWHGYAEAASYLGRLTALAHGQAQARVAGEALAVVRW